jgi:hypothetical protein
MIFWRTLCLMHMSLDEIADSSVRIFFFSVNPHEHLACLHKMYRFRFYKKTTTKHLVRQPFSFSTKKSISFFLYKTP